MVEPSLDTLDASSRDLVVKMLAAVFDHPKIHVNRFWVKRSRENAWTYFVGQHSAGAGTPFPQHSQLPVNAVPQLLHLGFVEGDPAPGAPPGGMAVH